MLKYLKKMFGGKSGTSNRTIHITRHITIGSTPRKKVEYWLYDQITHELHYVTNRATLGRLTGINVNNISYFFTTAKKDYIQVSPSMVCVVDLKVLTTLNIGYDQQRYDFTPISEQ